MPQDTPHTRTARLPSQLTEAAWGETETWGQWLTRLLSGWRFTDRQKLAVSAVLALLRGRAGRTLLRRLAVGSVLIVYNFVTIVEVIVGIVILAEVASRLIAHFTRINKADRGDPAVRNSTPSTSTSTSNDGYNPSTSNDGYHPSTSNDGYDRTGPTRRGRTTQNEKIQSHLQRLAMAAAAADAEASIPSAPSLPNCPQGEYTTVKDRESYGTGLAITAFNTGSNAPAPASPRAKAAAAADVEASTPSAPSLPNYDQREDTKVKYPESYDTSLAMTAFNTGSNAPALASPKAASRQARHDSSFDFCTTVKSQHRSKKHHNSREGPGRSVQDVDQSVEIHFELPIDVCNLTFWNDIHITVPSRPSSSPPSSGTAAKNRQMTQDHYGASSDGAGQFFNIKMRMLMEMKRDLSARGHQNVTNSCVDCLMGSHSVSKRRFDCTYTDGAFVVHKRNTFHEGVRLTTRGSADELNFKFETVLEQKRPSNNEQANFYQRVTFSLLPRTPKPSGQSSKHLQQSSKLDGRGSSPKRDTGGSGSGLLGTVMRTCSSKTAPNAVTKCSVESTYNLEDRRFVRNDYSGNSQLKRTASALGQGESGLDQRLFGSTMASSSRF